MMESPGELADERDACEPTLKVWGFVDKFRNLCGRWYPNTAATGVSQMTFRSFAGELRSGLVPFSHTVVATLFQQHEGIK